MILGYEEPVQMPTMDIYSTDLMKMYIEGVREQYKEGLDEYKDFMKQYQDFYSSLPGANEYWYNNTIKPAQDLIAQASSQGIDLFKSPEGRAAIRNMMNSVPLGKLKQVQAASEDYNKYLDSVGKLQEQGKYNPAFQDFILNQMYPGGYQLVDRNGNINPWKTRSATPYEDMTEYTAPWFEGMKDSYLGSTPDGKYNLIGINDDAMRPILDQNMADYMGSPLGQFHFQQFANTLPPGTTPEQAFNAFQNEIMAKNRRIQHVEREADPYAKDDYSTANDIRAHAANAATDWHYKQKEWYLEHPELDPNSPLYVGNGDSPYYGVSGRHTSRTQSTNKGKFSHALFNDYTSEDIRADRAKKYGLVWINSNNEFGGTYGIEDPNGTIKTKSGKTYRAVNEYEIQKLALSDANSLDAIAIDESKELDKAIVDKFGTINGTNKTYSSVFFNHLVPEDYVFQTAYGSTNKDKNGKNKTTHIFDQRAQINNAKKNLDKDGNPPTVTPGTKQTIGGPNVKYIGKSVVVLNKDMKHKTGYTRYNVNGENMLFPYAHYVLDENGQWVIDNKRGDWQYSLDRNVSNTMQGNGVVITNATDTQR